jgi:hypothetical protein
MSIRFNCAMFVLVLSSGICFAQAPKPALTGQASNEMSADFLVPVKGSDLLSYGFGGQIASTRFFSEHLGVKLQGDYMRMDNSNLRDSGIRIGPIVRFGTRHAVQPYLEALVGYARVEAMYLKPGYHGGGSVLAGGGFEFPLVGGWYAKAGVDVQDEWAASTRAGRGTVGVSYRFDRTRQPRY